MMKKHIDYIDFLRTFAIMAVVLIHCLPDEEAELSAGGGYFVQILHSCLNFAVPVFVMITGAVMLDRDESLKKTLMRTLRLLTALLVFGTAASWLEYFFNSRELFGSFKNAVFAVISGNSWSAMWFLYMLTGVYLTLPLFRLFVKNASDTVIIYTLAIMLVMNSIIPCINGFAGHTVIDFYLPIGSIYAFYLLLGYYIQCRRPRDIPPGICAALIAVCAALFALILYGHDPDKFSQMEYICSYASPVVIVMTCSVFSLCKRLKKSGAVVQIIARNSFGIYLIHCFYIHIEEYILRIHKEIANIPIMFISVFVLSLASSAAFYKIKNTLKRGKKP